MMRKIEKSGEISNILPKQIVGVFLYNSPIHAKTIIENHYIGLWIKTSGVIESINLMSDYTTFNFHDKDGIYISANFFKPVSTEVSLLNKGDQINLIGRVFNVAEGIVVLDNCVLTTENEAIKSQTKEIEPKWWEKTWVQLIMLLGAIAGIIGLIIAFS